MRTIEAKKLMINQPSESNIGGPNIRISKPSRTVRNQAAHFNILQTQTEYINN